MKKLIVIAMTFLSTSLFVPTAFAQDRSATGLATVIEGLLYYPYEGDISGGTATCSYGSSSMDINFYKIDSAGKIREVTLSDATASYDLTGTVKKVEGQGKYKVKLSGTQEYSTFTRTISFKGTVPKKHVNKIKNVTVDISVDYDHSTDCEYHIEIDQMTGIE